MKKSLGLVSFVLAFCMLFVPVISAQQTGGNSEDVIINIGGGSGVQNKGFWEENKSLIIWMSVSIGIIVAILIVWLLFFRKPKTPINQQSNIVPSTVGMGSQKQF